MVNQEIVEGLRHALERGSTLEKAMLSFWSSGYKNEEIEEAARSLISHPSQLISRPGKEIPKEMKQPVQTLPGFQKTLTSAPPIKTSAPALAKTGIRYAPALAKPEPIPYERTQLVSRYEEKAKSGGKFTIILLIIILLVFLGMLAGIIVFKKELIQFFNNLLF